MSDTVLRNPPDFWRYRGNDLVDLDNDGDIELVLGPQSPGYLGPSVPSVVLVNDGTGHYPMRIELSRPPLNGGYTRVSWLTHFDVNKDGFQDLLLAHRRLYEGPTNEIPDTGRYIQVLVNRGGTSFGDETPAWMGDQSATTPERDAEGNELVNDVAPRMHNIDRDGCADLVMSRDGAVRTESPLVYRNDGSGRFQAMSPVPFAGSDRSFGYGAVPAVGTLPARTLHVGDGAVAVVVSVAGAFRNASTYRASSSAPGVATVTVSGSQVTVTPVAAGVATITVTATGADNSVATQRFCAAAPPASRRELPLPALRDARGTLCQARPPSNIFPSRSSSMHSGLSTRPTETGLRSASVVERTIRRSR